MKTETLKRIFNFLEEKEQHKAPFIWKLKNDIPLTKEDLNVKGDLKLGQSKITSLPEGLNVEGDLSLHSFKKLTSLPEGLKVGGNLSLIFSGIESLPEGLKVGGNLYVGVTKLTKYTDDELREMVKPGFIKGKIRR